MGKLLYSLKVSQGSQGLRGLAERDTLNKVQTAYMHGVPFVLRMDTTKGYQGATFSPTLGGLLVDVGIAKDSSGNVHDPIPANADGTLWSGEGEPVMMDPEAFPKLLLSFLVPPWAARGIVGQGESASPEALQLVGGKVKDTAPPDPAAATTPPAEDMP